MDETRDEAVLRMFVNVMEHFALVETTLTVMLSGKVSDELRMATMKQLSDMTLDAIGTADGIRKILEEG